MTPSKLTGAMIKGLREKLGISQVEASEILGISEGSILNYERERRPDKEDPVKIPKLLDWALSALHGKLPLYSDTCLKKGKK